MDICALSQEHLLLSCTNVRVLYKPGTCGNVKYFKKKSRRALRLRLTASGFSVVTPVVPRRSRIRWSCAPSPPSKTVGPSFFSAGQVFPIGFSFARVPTEPLPPHLRGLGRGRPGRGYEDSNVLIGNSAEKSQASRQAGKQSSNFDEEEQGPAPGKSGVEPNASAGTAACSYYSIVAVLPPTDETELQVRH